MIPAVTALFIAAASAMAVARPVSRIGVLLGAVDYPGERRIHAFPTPRAGGLAILFAVAAGVFTAGASPLLLMPFTVALLLLALGLSDDVFSLSAGRKLTAECLLFSLLPLTGLSPQSLLLFGRILPLSPFLSGIFTVFFLAATTNAFNMIDGMDGLAGGYGGMAAGAIAFAASMLGAPDAACLSGALGGAFFGFYPANRHPARLFLGDSGSLCGGFLLGVSLLLLGGESLPLFPVLCFLLLPATDLLFAVVRRVAAGRNPMQADGDHLHHRLLSSGIGYRRTVHVLRLYAAAGILLGVSCLFFFSTK